jgi:hypothetical protein
VRTVINGHAASITPLIASAGGEQTSTFVKEEVKAEAGATSCA